MYQQRHRQEQEQATSGLEVDVMADLTRKTANLFDAATAYGAMYSDGVITGQAKAINDIRNKVTADMIGKTYTISITPLQIASKAFVAITINGTLYWRENKLTVNLRSSFQFTPVTENDQWFITYDNQGVCSYKDIMFNAGSTPLPYEPYGWLHSLRKLTTATEAVENPLYSDGTAITSYTIKGNTVQNGTPTPSNPVDVNGVGVRTENLFNTFISGIAIDTVTGAEVPSDSGFTSDYIAVDNLSFYSYSGGSTSVSVVFMAYDGNKSYIGRSTNQPRNTATIYTSTEQAGGNVVFASNLTGNTNPIAYIRICHLNGTQADVDSETIMFNAGSTALPYEPYGYKIPISNGQQTTNIYLGSTQTTRQIQKLVLDGTENWSENFTNYGYRFGLNVSDSMQSDTTDIRSLCTHLPLTVRGGTETNVQNVYVISATNDLIIKLSNSDRVSDLKSWLSQQYAAGTPVTIWYVLATPETATVNEPLMKIGDYADTLSNAAQIPTTEGANSITIDTTVRPSEFTATWTGWHNASVKEWDGSDWG